MQVITRGTGWAEQAWAIAEFGWTLTDARCLLPTNGPWVRPLQALIVVVREQENLPVAWPGDFDLDRGVHGGHRA